MRIDRMLAITVMMLNRNKITARELAEKFEVSVRTVYRDLDAINMAGIPIVSYPGNNGGYGIIENYKIDRQLLTLKDMGTILSALKGINTTLEHKELDHAIEKISSLVPKDKTEQIKLHCEQMVIDIMPWGYPQKLKEMIQILHQAVMGNNLLQLEYRNSKGEKNKRLIEPMTILYKGYTWYLFGYCHLRKEGRVFRLSRMRKLKILNQTFIRKKLSYQDAVKSAFKDIKKVRFVLKFPPKMKTRIEDYFGEKMIQYQKDGSLIVNISMPEDEWIYSYLLSYGEDMEILEPVRIRKIIEKKVEKIQKIYKQT